MITTPVRAVLFDLDGTLINSLQDIADAMNYALSTLHMEPYPLDAYKTMVGNGAAILAKRAAQHQPHRWEELLQAYQARYEVHKLDLSAPYAGIPEMLEALRRRGLALAVLSNKPDQDTQGVIRHFFPDAPFSIVRGQLPHVPVKPDPMGALAVADAMGIPPQDFLYLGDTNTDICCARNAGMRPVGVLWGFREKQELQEAGAEHIIAHPRELLSVLDTLTAASC